MQGGLRHPNVVKYETSFVDGRTLFIVMEMVEGASLQDHFNALGQARSDSEPVAEVPDSALRTMGAAGAVEILHRGEIAAAEDTQKVKDAFVEEYEERFSNPFEAASRGYIDDVFEPRFTRKRLCRALRLMHTKRDTNPPKKHGNIPL